MQRHEWVRMPLLSGTDIIFLVNYIISMWLKHSFNTTGKNRTQNSRGRSPPRKFRGDAPPPPPGSPLMDSTHLYEEERPGICQDTYNHYMARLGRPIYYTADMGIFWSTPPKACGALGADYWIPRGEKQFPHTPLGYEPAQYRFTQRSSHVKLLYLGGRNGKMCTIISTLYK